MNSFLEISSPDDQVGLNRLGAAILLDYTDMGPVLRTYRAWPGPIYWTIFGLLVLLLPFSSLTAPDSSEARIRPLLLTILPVFWSIGLLIGGLERHRVCQHGMVVGFRKRSKYYIPWSTVDPGRVRIAHNMMLVTRHPDLRHIMTTRHRLGLFSLHGVVLNGLDTTLTSPWNDPGPNPVYTPFGWWLLATRRGEDLVADIERAMVADGYRAQGLAARAKAQTLWVHWTPPEANPLPPRLGLDPIIGVDGPLLP